MNQDDPEADTLTSLQQLRDILMKEQYLYTPVPELAQAGGSLEALDMSQRYRAGLLRVLEEAVVGVDARLQGREQEASYSGGSSRGSSGGGGGGERSEREGKLTPRDRAVHTVATILSGEQCREVIKAAEEHAAAHVGWTSHRHAAHPTTDIPVGDIVALDWLFGTFGPLRASLLPAVAGHYGLEASLLEIEDLFVAKYCNHNPTAL